jgi:hypothetical protein
MEVWQMSANIRSQFARFLVKTRFSFFVPILIIVCLFSRQSTAAVLEKTISDDIAWSLLRDNYDSWSGELMNSILTDSTRSLAPVEERIERLTKNANEMSSSIRARLIELYRSPITDETSVQAALILARSATGKERREYLKNAVRYAQSIAPGSRSALRVSLVYLAQLLGDREFSDGRRLAVKVAELAGLDSLRGLSERCVAFALAGDAQFYGSEFGAAEEFYSKSVDCLADAPSSKKSGLSAMLGIRMSWVAFRLMKYQETLARLERLSMMGEWAPRELSTAVRTELSVMLAVSLSETSPNTLPSFWMREAQRSLWVADGLLRSLRYLAQKEAFKTAVRWIDSIEPIFSNSPLGLDYYATALDVYERDGALDSMSEFRMRAVLAIQPQGGIARAIASETALDARRRKLLREWARAVVSARAQQEPNTLSSSAVQGIFRVSEALYSESSEVCSELPTFVQSHRILAASNFEALAERVYSWFSKCSDAEKQKSSVTLNRLEMFRSAARRAENDKSAWASLVAMVIESLESHSDDSEIRKFALESIHDAIERKQFVDAENILLAVLMSQDSRSELFQMEREGIVFALMRLVVQPVVSPQLETAAWSLVGSLSSSSAPESELRFKFESIMSFFVRRQSLAKREQGKFTEAVEHLLSGAERFASDSVRARDLRMEGTLEACLAGLDAVCLSSGRIVNGARGIAAHDIFSLRHALGNSLYRQGRFLGAAESWLSAAAPALESGRPELIGIAKQDVIKAGDIYSELKMWPEVLSARSVLTKISSLSGDAANTHEQLLSWTLRAFSSGDFDVASALSVDLQEWLSAALAAQKNRSQARNPWMIASELVEQSVRFFAVPEDSGKHSKLALLLEESLLRAQKNNGSVLQAKPMLNRMLISLLSQSVVRWHNLVMSESDRVSRARDLAALEVSAITLSKNFDALVKMCRLSRVVAQEMNRSTQKCLDDVGGNFRLFVDRARGSASQLVDAALPKIRQVDSKLNAFLARILAVRSEPRSLDGHQWAPFNPMVERSRSPFGVGLGNSGPAGGAR